MNAHRLRHLENCLTQYDRLTSLAFPLDTFLFKYFAANPTVKASDKHFIVDQASDILRWRSLIDVVATPPRTWGSRVKAYYTSQRWRALTQNVKLPLHIRCAFPEALFERIRSSHGTRDALRSCLVLNEPAPRHIRVNTERIARDRLKCVSSDVWSTILAAALLFDTGLTLTSPHALDIFPEYQQKYFEFQDEGSQLVASRVACCPGDIVLVFCGTPGKAAIFGTFLRNKGRLVFHVPEGTSTLQTTAIEARMKAAGVRNYICCTTEQLQFWKRKAQWVGKCVVCDVECTSTACLRRRVHLKWNYSDSWLLTLIEKQRDAVKQAAEYLQLEKGKLVYITRSILREENEDQIDHFVRQFGLCCVKQPDISLPLSLGHDGFFCAVLKQRDSNGSSTRHPSIPSRALRQKTVSGASTRRPTSARDDTENAVNFLETQYLEPISSSSEETANVFETCQAVSARTVLMNANSVSRGDHGILSCPMSGANSTFETHGAGTGCINVAAQGNSQSEIFDSTQGKPSKAEPLAPIDKAVDLDIEFVEKKVHP